MHFMRPLLTAVTLLALVAGALYGVSFFFHTPTSLVTENETTDSPIDFQFEIADTPRARSLGLSGRLSIPTNYGMLFVFDTDDTYSFWMKDMFVPIDIIWLDARGVIVSINANVSPDSYPNAFYPPKPIRYVLETAVGESTRQNWDVGTRISLPR